MKRINKYCLIKNLTCLALFCKIIFFCAFGQCPSSATIYKQVIDLENNDSASAPDKLKTILFLKKQFEDCHLSKDSVYARILHRAGAMEYQANHVVTPSVLQNTLEAADINTSKAKNTSPKFAVRSYKNLSLYYSYLNNLDKELIYADSVIYYNQDYPDQKNYTIDALTLKKDVYGIRRDYEKYAEISTIGITESKEAKDTISLIGFYYNRAYSYCYQKIWKCAATDIDSGFYYAKLIGSNELIANLTNLKAVYYAGQKDYTNANLFFQKDLQLRIKNNDKDDLASDYLAIGNYFLDDFPEKSIPYYKKMTLLCSSPPNNIYLAQAYTATAEAYFRLRNLTEARRNDSIASFYLVPSSPKNFLQNATAKQLSVIDNKDLLLAYMNNKIELLLHLYKQNHLPVYLTACLQSALLMDTLVTKTRHEQLGEQTKLYWRNKTRDFFGNTVEACYISGNYELAFHFMEKSRAVLLYDKLNELGAAAHLSSEQQVKEEQYQIKLIEQQQKIAALQPNSPSYNQEQTIFFQTKDDFEHYTLSLEKTNPVYYQYKYADSIPSLSALQNYLGKSNQSFVHYFMNDSTIYALSVSKNKTAFIKITATDFNIRNLSDFSNLCSNKQALNNNYKTFASLSQTIYKALFKPLSIPGGNVTICTDNFFIPFEALCSDANGKNFLLYDYNFNYAYSARSLIKPVANGKAAGSFAGFAPVSFSSRLGVFPLLNSAAALTNVADDYNNSTLFTKQQATRSNFFSQASKYSVVTIFSHAQADTTDKEPVLYMQDSLIHLSELQMLRNPAIQFVLLSACQTNIGKNATGEGIYSLARGFAAAGVPAVSATLWKADEEAVYAISAKFNEYLAAGMNKSEALQKAKIWYLQNSDHEHTLPYYWANMVLIGSSQPVVLASSNTWRYWVAGIFIFVLLLLSGVYILYKKRVANKHHNNAFDKNNSSLFAG